MRIICPQCAAAYTIEDGQVALRGVRAQCPRCRHLHRVRAPIVTSGEMVDTGFLDDSGVPHPEELRPGGVLPDSDDWTKREKQLLDAMSNMESLPMSRPKALTDSTVRASPSKEVRKEIIRARPSLPRWARMLFVPFIGMAIGCAIAWFVVSKVSFPMKLKESEKQKELHSVDAILLRWRHSLPLAEGSAEDFMTKGNLNLESDLMGDYLSAQSDFQRALLLDPTNEKALVGLLRALTWDQSRALSPSELQDVQSIMNWVEEHSTNRSNAYLAWARLLIARNQEWSTVRKIAGPLLENADPRIRHAGHLALAMSSISSNLDLSRKHIDAALQLFPDSRRALRIKSTIENGLGDVVAAIQSEERRMNVAPKSSWADIQALVHQYLSIGEPEKAARILRTVGRELPFSYNASLVLAQIKYQVQHEFDDASELLLRLTQTSAPEERSLISIAFGHLSAVYRLQGKTQLAKSAANNGLLLDASEVNARLQLFLIALQEREPGVARGHWVLLKGRLSNVPSEKMLEGMLLLAEEKLEGALASFSMALAIQPERLDTLLLTARTASELQKTDESFSALNRAMLVDPLNPFSEELLFTHYVTGRDFLALSDSNFQTIRANNDDVTPDLAQGYWAFVSRDWGTAEKCWKRVLSRNKTHSQVLAYMGFMDIQRHRSADGLAYSQKALSLAPEDAFNHFVLGEALRLNGNNAEARIEYKRAIELRPTLLAARVRYGEMESLIGNASAARDTLLPVTKNHPNYWEARKVFFRLFSN